MENSTSWHQRKVIEVFVRIFLLAIYLVCELLTPFQRILQPEELWLYKYPVSASYIPMSVLWLLALIIPISVVLIFYMIQKEKTDLVEALWCLSLIVSLNGAITNTIKVMVGRPRPDYLERCFPDGKFRSNAACTGDLGAVIDGRKSFPSGHSSVAFASFGFLSFYLAGKLHVFTQSGKRSSLKLFVVLAPLFFALCVAISRTCDYHHHWQDVFVGSIIGLAVCFLCYYQYYPPITSDRCHIPWKIQDEHRDNNSTRVKEI